MRLAFCFAVLVVWSASLALPADAGRVVFAQVVHRHGARTPLVDANEEAICGSIGCGLLTDNGKDMLRQLGLWARNRYMIDPANPQPETQYIANRTWYDPRTIVQRSTDVTRTLQSAAAFLQGLYDGHNSSYFPVIATQPLETDSLLYVKSNPSFYLPYEDKQSELHDIISVTAFAALNYSTWIAIGQELGLSVNCVAGKTTLTKCTHEIYDVAASFYASGRLTHYPLTARYYLDGTLTRVHEAWHALLYRLNASSADDRHRGPIGRPIVGELVKQVKDFVDGKQKAQLREYSAHDTTCVTMALALNQGSSDATNMNYEQPPFGDAYWLELMMNGTTYNVRMLHGGPTQEPGLHLYNDMRPFPLQCTNSSGHTYTVGWEGCPVGDFANYYENTIAPTDASGICHVPADVKSHFKCDKTGSSAPDKKECSFFRSACPEWACPSGSYLEFPNLNCKSL